MRGTAQIVLRGRRFAASYDPRLGAGGDKRERSGVIMLPAADLAALVAVNERLRVVGVRGGVVKLD